MIDISVTKSEISDDEKVGLFLSSQSVYSTIYEKYGRGKSAVEEPSATSEKVESITTHCAKIYLGAGFAVKTKLPVQYSYLDMSRLSDRHRYLSKELEINQPHLPDIYLGVAAIVKGENQKLKLIFGDSVNASNVLEWCLLMRRFREEDVLDNRANNGQLGNEVATQLGKSVADYHNSLEPLMVSDGDERINEVIEELKYELHEVKQCFDEKDLSEFGLRINKEYQCCKNALKNRAKTGFLKRCHGDLHLRNILLHQGKPVPFDALEFNDRFATTDTLYDLAFLLMDLDHRDLVEQQNIVLNEYLLRTDESNIGAMKLLPLFMCCRAGIKAMTTAQSATADGKKNSAKVREANQYLKKALLYLQPKEPIVLAIGGFSGSGKSTVARQLSTLLCQSPGAILLRSDVERKAEFDVGEFDDLGSDHYTAENSKRVYQRLMQRSGLAADTGYPVIVDASFLGETQRRDIEGIAINASVDFLGFWLMAPVDVMRHRISSRSGDASDADTTVLDKQLKRSKGHIDWHPVDTNKSVDKSLVEIMRTIWG